MYLKRIELEGFKSFADRTVFHAERGLTGIVGPNGSGKSNVVDALLWVMGERSAKVLRADAMDDVIFKGAEGRPPAPYAMVEIVLVDEGGQVVEAGAELAVGRRLLRTGESEYLINGRRVRRKEIRELLLDTGLGVSSYMVLAQGRIDAVLSANPAERRSVFEEASGISRYKARKHETGLKLARVAQDLARIEDVLGEVQRSVRSLKIQAGKARRYAEVRDRARELRIRLAWIDAAGLAAEEARVGEASQGLEGQYEALRSHRETCEARLRELSEETAALRARAEQLRGEAGEARAKAAALEERVHGLEGQLRELGARREREAARLAELDEGEDQGDSVVAELEREGKALDAEESLVEAELEAAREAHAILRKECGELRERAESLRRELLDALAERTRSHNLAAAAARERSEAEGNLRACERRVGELQKERERFGAELAQAREAARSAVVRASAGEEELERLLGERERLRQESAAAAAGAEEAARELAAVQARRAALRNLEEQREACPEALREFLKRADAPGLVLDGLRIPAPWDRLLENLLGRLQHGLWLEDRSRSDGLAAEGCDCFFPLAQAPAPVHVPGVPSLRSLLEGDPERCDALCARLGEVYCVPDAGTARKLAEAHPGAYFLSEDGEFHGRGYARLGMLAGESADGILARHNALAATEQEEHRAAERQRECERESARTREAERALERRLQDLDGSQREAVAERDRSRARLEDLERRVAALMEESRALEQEREELRAAREEARKAEEAALAARDRAEERRRVRATTLEELGATLEEREQERERAQQRLQEARLVVERHAQRLAHLEERRAALEQMHDRDRREREKLRAELLDLATREERMRERAEADRLEAARQLEVRVEREERAREAQQQAERAEAALAAAREQDRGSADRLEELLRKRQELALALQRVQLQRGELVRQLQEEFHQPLEDLARTVGLEADDARIEEEELAALRAEWEALRQRLDGFGAVNLEAVHELEEREERLSFLERERRDLLEARTRLEETIEDLDARSRERFLATFAAVQDQFEGIFRRLFRGGRADLSLEDGEDPLQAGIEIHARPPGKELRSIKLLSGGERTLTALALLLAVFRSRPSPFCVLDEVDAALDDANIARFLDVLEDFTSSTQFLVVTHNKLTMAHCESLFGVTMRKAGVSLVVSVDLSEIPDQVSERSTERVPERRLPARDERAGETAPREAAQPPVAELGCSDR